MFTFSYTHNKKRRKSSSPFDENSQDLLSSHTHSSHTSRSGHSSPHCPPLSQYSFPIYSRKAPLTLSNSLGNTAPGCGKSLSRKTEIFLNTSVSKVAFNKTLLNQKSRAFCFPAFHVLLVRTRQGERSMVLCSQAGCSELRYITEQDSKRNGDFCLMILQLPPSSYYQNT